MSLINDMLSNLEAGRPNDLAGQALQREIRPLPRDSRGPGVAGKWALFGALVLAVGAAALYGTLRVSPVPVSLPAEKPPAAAPSLPPTSVPKATVDAPKGAISEQLRLDSRLAFMLTPAVPMLPAPGPARPLSAVPVAEAAGPVAEAAKQVPARIEKTPALATPRDLAEIDYRRAEGALASGQTAEGVDSLRAALRHDPTYVQVRQLLLRQLLDMRKTDEAMAALKDGLEIQPMQTGWAMSLARLQLEQNDFAAADATLARSQAYGDANADYAGFQGHVKSRLGAQRQAVVHYQRAARLAPSEGRWWLGLGLALEADGHLPEARDAFRRSLATTTLSADLAAVAEQHLH